MDKARRNEIKKLKYKKRLIRIGEWNEDTKRSPKGEKYDFTGFLNSSNPCSCWACRGDKYNRAKVKKTVDANTQTSM
jgi:hypothetical protein